MHWPTYVGGVVTGLVAPLLVKFIRGCCIAVTRPQWVIYVEKNGNPVAGRLHMREAFKRMTRHNAQVRQGLVSNKWSVRYDFDNLISR